MINLWGAGVWFIKIENEKRRLSVFCDKKNFLINFFPKKFFTQWNGYDIAQRSLYPNAYIFDFFFNLLNLL